MGKRFGLLTILLLLGGIVAAPSPGIACMENINCPDDPLYDPVPTLPNIANTVNAVKNTVGNAGSLVATRFALTAYPMKYLKPTGTFLPGGHPGMTVNTQQAVASNGCDPYPPNAQSCHQWWAGARWDSPYREGAYKIEWTIFFWTDQSNKYITATTVRCRDYPGNSWSTDYPCYTNADPYAAATIRWEAHYNYKQHLCPAAPSIYAHEDIYAQVSANRSISGTWVHDESAGC